ncbi:hypothetical protein TWF679_002252 [Orbilia oligospora]|uniref:Nucleoside phosphorylase domain-containing protein n=1 Tax=Orbilia oligospora TaxID=2813651 RepID=A0A8H8VGA7_ORBOL|nr:hypothetical protein TWF679_002252 [Orbilia oligospora]
MSMYQDWAAKKLGYEAYTIGWTAILKAELEASRLLLDEEHELLPPGEKDGNNYILGRMGLHNIVIAFPGPHAYASAAELMENMLQTFRNIRFGLLVGVGGAAPSLPNLEDASKDIRLGDVVVSDPNGAHGGLLQYDLDDWRTNGEFHIKSTLNKPPGLLVKSVRLLRSDQSFGRGEMGRYIQRAIAIKKAIGQSLIDGCQYPGQDQDRLFEAGYQHVGGDDCSKCNAKMVERRLQRDTKEPEVHYGLIASAKKELRRAEVRDKLHDVSLEGGEAERCRDPSYGLRYPQRSFKTNPGGSNRGIRAAGEEASIGTIKISQSTNSRVAKRGSF